MYLCSSDEGYNSGSLVSFSFFTKMSLVVPNWNFRMKGLDALPSRR